MNLFCTAPKDKTLHGIGAQRCGAPAEHETSIGMFCTPCLEYIRKNYDTSMLKLLKDAFEGQRPT